MYTLLKVDTDKQEIKDENGNEVTFKITCGDGAEYTYNSGFGVLRMAAYLMSIGMSFTVDKE